MLPGVFHVSARTLSTHALSIFGDHSDVIGVRSTGFAMLASSSPQEVMDLGAVAHLSAIHCRMPFLHFFDGFRTSHEIQKIEALDYEDLRSLVDMDALRAFRRNSLNPEHPATRGTTVNPDIFFQCREACNEKVDSIPEAVEKYMAAISKLTGREYKLFNYYGAADAERVVVLMGSGAETAKEAIDYLTAQGEKVGLLNVHLYRPFAADKFLSSIPASCKKLAVLDRTKEPGAMGEPLYQDICSVYKEKGIDMEIVGGRYGLSSKDTTPGQIIAVLDNLKQDKPKHNFTVGIVDDVTHTSLPVTCDIDTAPAGQTSAEFWGMGSDGTVGANKNSIKIARGLGLGNRTNTILQAAFFKLANVIPLDQAVSEMKDAIYKTYYKKKGQAVVDMNNASIEHGINELNEITIPASWLEAKDEPVERKAPDFIREVVDVMNRQEGDSLPVSVMKKYGLEDGTWHAGSTKYEKRGAAVDVPQWDMTKCIQCNQCSLVCPHAAIRPVLLDENEVKNAPQGFETKKANGLAQYQYRMQVSPYDCTGCGSCVNVCPAKEKALTMQPLESQLNQAENWEYAVETVTIKTDAVSDKTVKASQFAKPYFEFSGACAGCGETPYIKLVTQLFGDHMYITNASGCSSAYGGSTPSTPYCTDCKGCGPAWAMSLFEDNAEYAYGYLLGQDAIKRQLKAAAQILADKGVAADVCKEYIEKAESSAESRMAADALLAAVSGDKSEEAEFIRSNKEFLTKKSVWAFGGDGWAYDIGYGGLDHVLASGKNINVLVLDTEVYSNTGGQSSKATAAAAIAKFSAGGKVTKKKDLGMMAMSYGYVYVAQVAMGADPAQTLKAIREAEAYDGPSIVICYCPCIEHGMKASMGLSQIEEKKAVECGYWHLYRYDPRLKAEGKNPFQLDSKAPTGDFQQFLMGENRYASLKLSFPEKAEALYNKAASDAKERYEGYVKLAKE